MRKFTSRWPEALFAKIEKAAKANKRDVMPEIRDRIEKSFENEMVYGDLVMAHDGCNWVPAIFTIKEPGVNFHPFLCDPLDEDGNPQRKFTNYKDVRHMNDDELRRLIK